jgi:hypothetical protein
MTGFKLFPSVDIVLYIYIYLYDVIIIDVAKSIRWIGLLQNICVFEIANMHY